MNTDLYNLANWFSKNKLTLNISKSKFMIFGHSARTSSFSTLSLTVCAKKLDRVESFKYLGVPFDQRLSWEEHIVNIATKVKKRIGILNRIKYLLPRHERIIYYNSMIKPILEYNGIIWGDKGNTVLMETLQVLQNKAANTIFNRDLHSSATQALVDLNCVSLYKRRTIDRCFLFTNV